MSNKQIKPEDFEIPYKHIPACEIKDCDHLVYAGNNIYGCRFAETGLLCDDFNNPDEACMYRQLEYYKEALKAKEQECEELKEKYLNLKEQNGSYIVQLNTAKEAYEVCLVNKENRHKQELDQLKKENDKLNNRVEISGEIIDQIIKVLYPEAKDDELFAIAFNGDYIEDIKKNKAENDELKNRVAELSLFQIYKIQRDEAEKALTEIKELAKCGWDMFMERNSYEDYEAMAEWMKNQFYFILQKISEVGNEEKENG